MTSQADIDFKIRITPKSASETLLLHRKCLFGLSVSSKKLAIREVISAFRWATKRFSPCAILVGDSLYRITLQIEKGFNEQIATRKARQAGDDYLHIIFENLDEMPVVFRCSDLMHQSKFLKSFNEIKSQFLSNSKFRDAIKKDATNFVLRQEKRGHLPIERNCAISLSIQYLQEEIAVYLLLAEQGWLVDVYLGDELPTLAKIIHEQIPNAPMALTRRINVSLRPSHQI